MRFASDFMTPNPKMIGSDDTIVDVIRLFLEQGITSSPVVTPTGEILGVITELSLIKAYMLHRARFHKDDRIGHHMDLLEPISYVGVDSTIIQILSAMISSPTHRLLVKNERNKIVGILSPKDLMRAMLGEENPAQSMRQKLRAVEAQLKTSIEKLKSLAENLDVYKQAFNETPYLMHAVNADGIILMANKREHETLGYEDGELPGKSIYDIYEPSMLDHALEGLKTVIETGYQDITYTTLLTKDHKTVRCDISSAAIYGNNGEFVSTISVLRPIDPDDMLRILQGIVETKGGPLAKHLIRKKS
jgi:PAS domain S-box-containing protein